MMRSGPNEHDESEGARIRRLASDAGLENPDVVVLASFKRSEAHARGLTARLPRDLAWSEEPEWTPPDRPESDRDK